MMARVCVLMAGASLAAAGIGALPAAAQRIPAPVAAAVADAGRPAADTARDADRKPGAIIAFAGVKEGQKIVELFPGGGYFTRMLSKIVGPKGHIYMITPSAFQARGQKGADELAAALPNTSVLFQPVDAPTPPETVDIVWTTDNYHDFRNKGFGAADMAKFNKAVFDSLKPGGAFLVVDWAGGAGTGASQTQTFHRIDPGAVKQEVEAAGFKLEAESKLLANPNDDHSLSENDFKAKAVGKADEFVLLFRKPK